MFAPIPGPAPQAKQELGQQIDAPNPLLALGNLDAQQQKLAPPPLGDQKSKLTVGGDKISTLQAMVITQTVKQDWEGWDAHGAAFVRSLVKAKEPTIVAKWGDLQARFENWVAPKLVHDAKKAKRLQKQQEQMAKYEMDFGFASGSVRSYGQTARLLDKLLQTNREDLVDEVLDKYFELHGQGFDLERFIDDPSYVQADNPNPYEKHPDVEKKRSWHPEPAIDMKVHPDSVKAYQMASAGHCLTGIVCLDMNPQTVFLFPNQPTDGYVKRGVRPYGKDFPIDKASVMGKQPNEYIVHKSPKKKDATSHGLLSDMVYGQGKGVDKQQGGSVVGFTVFKGGKLSVDKFSFMSRSSNMHSFKNINPNPKVSKKKKRNGKLDPNKLAQLRGFGNLMQSRQNAKMGAKAKSKKKDVKPHTGQMPKVWMEALVKLVGSLPKEAPFKFEYDARYAAFSGQQDKQRYHKPPKMTV